MENGFRQRSPRQIEGFDPSDGLRLVGAEWGNLLGVVW